MSTGNGPVVDAVAFDVLAGNPTEQEQQIHQCSGVALSLAMYQYIQPQLFLYRHRVANLGLHRRGVVACTPHSRVQTAAQR